MHQANSIGQLLRAGPSGASPNPSTHLLCAAAESAVAATFGLHPAALRERTRGAYLVAFARQAAMYLSHVVFGLTYTQVGRAFRRDRTTAAHACRLVEERREDPTIDALLGALEAVCHAIRDGVDRELHS